MFMTNWLMRSPDGVGGGPPAATPQGGIPTTTPTGGMPQPAETVRPAQFPQSLESVVPGPVEPGREAPPVQKPAPDQNLQFDALMQIYNEEKQRRSGTDRRLDTEIAALKQGFEEIKTLLSGGTAPVGQQPQNVTPQPDATPSTEQSEVAELREMLMEERAVRLTAEATARATGIATEMSQPGQPGEGINLDAWMDTVDLHSAEDDPDGSQQRGEFEKIINRIKGVRQQATDATTKAMITGMTPGMSPGAGGTPSVQDRAQEMRDLHEQVNAPGFSDLPKNERDQLLERYDELGPSYGHLVSQQWSGGGWRSTQMNTQMMHELMRQLDNQGIKIDLGAFEKGTIQTSLDSIMPI